MARPATTLRIDSISPEDAARRAVQIASQRTGLTSAEDPLETHLGRATAQLTRYARGELAEGAPAELLYAVCRGVYGTEPDVARADLNSVVGVVVLAARARQKIEGKHHCLTTSEVAAVAGIDTSTVRRMARDGAIARPDRGAHAAADVEKLLARIRASRATQAPAAEPPPAPVLVVSPDA